MKAFLTASEASAELGVSPATLYAYVSRGMVRSQSQPGSRRKLYVAEDVRALRGRGDAGGAAFGEAADVIETALTLIRDGRLHYRGTDVAVLAASARFETVAGLLWQAGEDVFEQAADFAAVATACPGCGVVSRLIADLAIAAERDPAGLVHTPDGIARTGARILRQMTMSLTGACVPGEPIHRALARGWDRPAAHDVIRTALVALADHELAASTYAVRVTASTGASPWRAVCAGLACLDGPRHGGVADQVAGLLDEIATPADAEAAFVRRLKAGQTVPGFGHPLYAGWDPRCRLLLDRLRADVPHDRTVACLDAAVAVGSRVLGRWPNVDFGLAAACRASRLPHDAPIALFAVARTAGWVGHVIEQARGTQIIRPRARYVGRLPD